MDKSLQLEVGFDGKMSLCHAHLRFVLFSRLQNIESTYCAECKRSCNFTETESFIAMKRAPVYLHVSCAEDSLYSSWYIHPFGKHTDYFIAAVSSSGMVPYKI
jgi:hypothetical protein